MLFLRYLWCLSWKAVLMQRSTCKEACEQREPPLEQLKPKVDVDSKKLSFGGGNYVQLWCRFISSFDKIGKNSLSVWVWTSDLSVSTLHWTTRSRVSLTVDFLTFLSAPVFCCFFVAVVSKTICEQEIEKRLTDLVFH